MADPRDTVLEETRPLAARFHDAGHRLFLVGGIVRDLHLGAPIRELDVDLTTDARPVTIRAIVSPVADVVWTQGERFGTIGCRIGTRDYEITTHRAEFYTDEASRRPAVEFGDDVEGDLSRRDFTVNAMAIDLADGALVDPFGGRAALEERRLDTPIDPHVSFRDDPLRILRAARFVARYGLNPAPRVVAAARELVDRLDIVSVERIRDELDKLLTAEKPGEGIVFLDDVGALPRVLGELDTSIAELVSELDETPAEPMVRRVVVLRHLGAVAGERARTLRWPNATIREIETLLRGIDRVRAHAADWSDEDVRRMVHAVGVDGIGPLTTALRGRPADRRGADALAAAFAALADREDLTDLEPRLDGEAVMNELGLRPGPEVGAALDRLRGRRLVRGPATAAEELEYLRGA